MIRFLSFRFRMNGVALISCNLRLHNWGMWLRWDWENEEMKEIRWSVAFLIKGAEVLNGKTIYGFPGGMLLDVLFLEL